MDGVSAAASIAALIQISGSVFDLCRKYYSEVKDARKEIQRLRDEVTSLQDVLFSVADLAEAANPTKMSILDRLNQADGPVKQCQAQLAGLVAKLEPGEAQSRMRQFGSRALKWPFSKKEVENVMAAIERYKTSFNLAVTADLA